MNRRNALPASRRGPVVVQAYLSRNFGDDLMLFALANSYPETHFWCPSLDFGRGSSLSALRNLHPTTWRAALDLIIRDRASFVIIGGSMFIGRKGMHLKQRLRTSRKLLKWFTLGTLSRIRGQQFCIVGVNIGPIETHWFAFAFKRIFRAAGRVTVRDTPSGNLLEKWKIQRYVVAPDLVFALVDDTAVARVNRVGVSVMSWPHHPVVDVVAWYVELIRALLKEESVDELSLFAFQSLVVDDRIIIDAIVEMFPQDSRVTKVAYVGDIQGFLGEFETCAAFVGTRFHSLVLAIGMGIPLTAICYSDKSVAALEDLGWSQPLFRTSELSLSDVGEVAANVVAAVPFRPDTTFASRHLTDIFTA